MDGLLGLLLLLAVVVVIGGIFGWVSFFRLNSLSDAYRQLSAEFKQLKQQLSEQSPPSQQSKSSSTDAPVSKPEPKPEPPLKPKTVTPTQSTATAKSQTSTPVAQPSETLTSKPLPATSSSPNSPEPADKPTWFNDLADNWMIWLGGISVALAGIFMVKYSINMGLLGPKTQISLAIMTGLVLHAVAEWLRRRKGGSDIFASLAGGASITLYAALLAALHIYHLMEPGWIFVLLAIVSVLTMGLALVHGPMLAMLGLIGAYVVPILVSTNSGNMIAALIYSLIISASALLLMRYVFRPWLWWSTIIGALGWWLLSLSAQQADSFRGVYLAIFAWALLAIPHFDWLLQGKASNLVREPDDKTFNISRFSFSMNQLALLLIIFAWGGSIFWQAHNGISFALWAPLVLVIGVAATGRQSLWPYLWISLLVQWLAWFAIGFDYRPSVHGFQFMPLPNELTDNFLAFAGAMTFLYSALSAWQWWRHGFSHARVSLTFIAPLAWLALAYLHVNGLSQSLTWSLSTLLLGLVYAAVAGWRLQRNQSDSIALWLTLAAHFAYSLAVVLYFREALLSLALAAQLLSLTWLIKRYQLPWLELLVKVVLAAVVLRLTFNPWLADYPTDVHWSIITYGGATLFAFFASRICDAQSKLRVWLEAATLHLLVLTLGTELRYWLYDGQIFIERYDLVEAAINTSLWAALALTYYYRAQLSDTLKTFYQIGSKILLLMALASYAIMVGPHNPWWSGKTISSTPIFNILLLAYGAPIVWALLVAYYHQANFRKIALRIAGFASLLFITLEIRQLWRGSDLSLDNPTSDGEVYTYSVVWMLMAISAVLFGARFKTKGLYQAGMMLLLVVIAKIFLIDMAGLDGLWRVASFMGLGLSLLALAWFYRKIKAS